LYPNQSVHFLTTWVILSILCFFDLAFKLQISANKSSSSAAPKVKGIEKFSATEILAVLYEFIVAHIVAQMCHLHFDQFQLILQNLQARFHLVQVA